MSIKLCVAVWKWLLHRKLQTAEKNYILSLFLIQNVLLSHWSEIIACSLHELMLAILLYIPRLNWNVNEQENLQNFDSSSYLLYAYGFICRKWIYAIGGNMVIRYANDIRYANNMLIRYASWTRVQRWLQIISLVGNFQNNILLAEDRNWKQSHYEPVLTLD